LVEADPVAEPEPCKQMSKPSAALVHFHPLGHWLAEVQRFVQT